MNFFNKLNLFLKNKQEFYDEKQWNHLPMRKLIFLLIEHYGFIECDQVKKFLKFCCSDNICKAEALYIEEKLGSCLLYHDDGNKYFDKMKQAYDVVIKISRNHESCFGM